jgi:hypothetical protein
MIRTLVILAVVSFVLSIGCLAAALAIAGGPFYIDQDLRYHRDGWDIDISTNDGRMHSPIIPTKKFVPEATGDIEKRLA